MLGRCRSQSVDGGQDDDDLGDRATRPVEHAAEPDGGDVRRQDLHRGHGDALGCVAEDEALLFQCPEQAAQTDVNAASDVALALFDRQGDVLASDPAESVDLGLPGVQNRADVAAVLDDRIPTHRTVASPALPAQNRHPPTATSWSRSCGSRTRADVDADAVQAPAQAGTPWRQRPAPDGRFPASRPARWEGSAPRRPSAAARTATAERSGARGHR